MKLTWMATRSCQIYGVQYSEGQTVNTSGWDWRQKHNAITGGVIAPKTPIPGAVSLSGFLEDFSEPSPVHVSWTHTVASTVGWEGVETANWSFSGGVPSWVTFHDDGAGHGQIVLPDGWWYAVSMFAFATFIADGQYIGTSSLAGMCVNPRVTSGGCQDFSEVVNGGAGGGIQVLAQVAGAHIGGLFSVNRIARVTP